MKIKRRGGGVSLYIHNSLQYKVRNDLKIGNDQETINSVFVEIDKNTTNTKRNLIVGCIYRPPWVKIADFITALTPKLEKLRSENKYTLLMRDYNVDIALNLTWQLKNLRIFFLLIIFSLLLIRQPEIQNP